MHPRYPRCLLVLVLVPSISHWLSWGGGGNQINFDTDITVTKCIFLVLFYIMFLVVFALVCGIPVLHHSYTSCVTRSEIYPDFFTMSNV